MAADDGRGEGRDCRPRVHQFLPRQRRLACRRRRHPGAGEHYGRSQHGEGQRIQVEFVSANPTGPLHVGHGRGAAYGAAVADLLSAIGYDVHREYYVNDAGRQMDILAASVYLRYLDLCGET